MPPLVPFSLHYLQAPPAALPHPVPCWPKGYSLLLLLHPAVCETHLISSHLVSVEYLHTHSLEEWGTLKHTKQDLTNRKCKNTHHHASVSLGGWQAHSRMACPRIPVVVNFSCPHSKKTSLIGLPSFPLKIYFNSLSIFWFNSKFIVFCIHSNILTRQDERSEPYDLLLKTPSSSSLPLDSSVTLQS